MRAYFVFADCG